MANGDLNEADTSAKDDGPSEGHTSHVTNGKNDWLSFSYTYFFL